MPDIVFPASTAPGFVPAESGGRLINAYSEDLPGLPKAQYVIRRSAGVSQFSDTTRTGFRGMFADANQLFSAWANRLVWTNSAGVTADIGALLGTDFVTFARNNKTPTPDYLVATGNGLFPFTTAGIAGAVALPAAALANSIAFGDGFFFAGINDSRVYASDPNALTWNALNVAQFQNRPGLLIRVLWFNGELYGFKEDSCEVWGSGGSPNPSGFPLRRTTVIPRGLAAKHLVTGWELKFGGPLAWISDDNTVRRLASGYGADVISTPTLHKLIEAVTDRTMLSMGCYTKGGRQMIFIRSPTWWWGFDCGAERWHERRSYGSTTARIMGSTAAAFDKWIFADANSGVLGYVDGTVYTEFLNPLIFLIESAPSEQYPARIKVNRVSFTLQQGTGIPAGALDAVVPQLEISFSDDDGNSWFGPILRPIGAMGNFRTMVDATQLGLTGHVGRRWRLACPAAVYCGVFKGVAELELRH